MAQVSPPYSNQLVCLWCSPERYLHHTAANLVWGVVIKCAPLPYTFPVSSSVVSRLTHTLLSWSSSHHLCAYAPPIQIRLWFKLTLNPTPPAKSIHALLSCLVKLFNISWWPVTANTSHAQTSTSVDFSPKSFSASSVSIYKLHLIRSILLAQCIYKYWLDWRGTGYDCFCIAGKSNWQLLTASHKL